MSLRFVLALCAMVGCASHSVVQKTTDPSPVATPAPAAKPTRAGRPAIPQGGPEKVSDPVTLVSIHGINIVVLPLGILGDKPTSAHDRTSYCEIVVSENGGEYPSMIGSLDLCEGLGRDATPLVGKLVRLTTVGGHVQDWHCEIDEKAGEPCSEEHGDINHDSYLVKAIEAVTK